MTLTAHELKLQSNTDVLGYIQGKNIERNAQAKAEGWEFWTLMPEDGDFVGQFKNVYELEHMYACETYNDVYKEMYCGRPRHSYKHWTLSELWKEIEEMY